MRTGGCTVQQALTPEAGSVVKQAVTLARRRGHAQVTPLHVANTMLSASTGLLRTACLQSHNHPLQCRALELCFNVALNRLPASTSAPMHHHQLPQYPSISNALVAAFKRAQAHQRRGSVETQQQPLLAVKIELDQLVISILDDPSVSRVMREAGFSSTQVKSNVEQAVSLEICSQQTTTGGQSKDNKLVVAVHGEEDVRSVIEKLVNHGSRSRRGVAIVGESLGTAEGVVKGVMERVEKGEVPEGLRRVKFVSVPPNFGEFFWDELKGVVRGYMEKGGVVVNLGDLKWAADDDVGGRSRMEELVMELGKLSCNDELGRLWMVGVATFQTYTKCKSRVESVWGLHPVTIPAGILRLTLLTTTDSELQSQSTVNINNSTSKGENAGRSSSSWNIIPGAGEEEAKQRLNYGCGTDCCSGKLENEENKNNGTSSCCNSCDSPTSSTLPAWLRPYKSHNHQQDSVSIKDLCKKWNSSPDLQITSHHHHHDYHTTNTRMRNLTFASLVSPSHSPSTSISSYLDPTSFRHHQPPWRSSTTTTSPSLDPILHHHHNFWPTKTLPIDHLHSHGPSTVGPALRVFIPDYSNNKQNPPPFFSSNPNSLSTTPNSTSSSDNTTTDYSTHRFNSLNSDNLKALCTAMETKVPRQRHVIPDIATTILQCRSGMISRRRSKEDTWLFFQGADVEAKEAIAKEIARLVFGSHHSLVSISLSNFSSAEDYTHSSSRSSCKRGRPEDEKSYVERFAEAVGRDPHRVFFVEDVEQADYCSQVGFKRAMESGKVTRRNSGGDEDEDVRLGDAIVILSCEGSFSCRSSRACSPTSKHKINIEGRAVKEVGDDDDDDEKMEEGESPCLSLDLNICIEDEDDDEVQSIDDIGILELVDRRIVFKLPREEDQL